MLPSVKDNDQYCWIRNDKPDLSKNQGIADGVLLQGPAVGEPFSFVADMTLSSEIPHRATSPKEIAAARYAAVMAKAMQRTKPCSTCPFSRKAEKFAKDPQALGGSNGPEVFLGQAHGPFVLPCHKRYKQFASESSDGRMESATPGNGHECAGAAIYRSNCNADVPKELAKLPANRHEVFNGPEEFLAHHMDWSSQEAEDFLKLWPTPVLVKMELAKVFKQGGKVWISG